MCLAEYARSIVLRQYLYLEGLCVPKLPKYGDKFQATHPFGRQFRHCVPWHFQRSSSNGKKIGTCASAKNEMNKFSLCKTQHIHVNTRIHI